MPATCGKPPASIMEAVRSEKMSLAEVDEVMNDETASFLGLQLGREEAAAALGDLRKFRGPCHNGSSKPLLAPTGFDWVPWMLRLCYHPGSVLLLGGDVPVTRTTSSRRHSWTS